MGSAGSLPRVWRRSLAAIAGLALALGAGGCVGGGDSAANGQSSALSAAQTVHVKRELDKALRQARVRTHTPAATAAVFHCGKLVWTGGSGRIAEDSARPVRRTTRFITASAGKVITATMAMQLVEAGKLSLDQKLSGFYPRLPNAERITIRQLLNHTSGLPNYVEDGRIADIADRSPRYRWTREKVLSFVRKANFAPGTDYEYSNTNYLLLGGIIEAATGRSVERSFQEGIAQRSVMPRTTFVYSPKLMRLFAHPHYDEGDGIAVDAWTPGLGLPTDYWGEVWTDGGLASTAPDLGRSLDALFAGKLVSPATLALMTKVGGPDDYGLGLYAKGFAGHRWFGHDGYYVGYESENWHDAKRDVTITLMSNLTEPEDADETLSDRIWRALARAYENAAPKDSCPT